MNKSKILIIIIIFIILIINMNFVYSDAEFKTFDYFIGMSGLDAYKDNITGSIIFQTILEVNLQNSGTIPGFGGTTAGIGSYQAPYPTYQDVSLIKSFNDIYDVNAIAYSPLIITECEYVDLNDTFVTGTISSGSVTDDLDKKLTD